MTKRNKNTGISVDELIPDADTAQEPTTETVEDTTQDTTQETAQETVEDAVEEPATETVEETSEDAVEDNIVLTTETFDFSDDADKEDEENDSVISLEIGDIDSIDIVPDDSPVYVRVMTKDTRKVVVIDASQFPDYKKDFLHCSGNPFSE